MNRDQFLTAVKRVKRIEPVQVDGFEEPLFVCGMSGKDRDNFEAEQHQLNEQGKTLDNFRARIVARCLCDANGNRLFSEKDAGEVGDIDAAIVGKLFSAAARLNGMLDADEAKKN